MMTRALIVTDRDGFQYLIPHFMYASFLKLDNSAFDDKGLEEFEKEFGKYFYDMQTDEIYAEFKEEE